MNKISGICKLLLVTTSILLSSASCDKLNKDEGLQAIDLGLKTSDGRPLKWATCNVGAESPAESGQYFSWAEIKEKESYGRSDYAYGNIDFDDEVGWNGMTKYGPDGLCTLLPEDDAATVMMGSKWRTPTQSELCALMDKDYFTWKQVVRKDKNGNKVPGYEITSKISGYEGKSIFLPFSGYKFQRVLRDPEVAGCYWSSELYSDDGSSLHHYGQAWSLQIDEDEKKTNLYGPGRYFGMNIRAVTSE